jgi:hypothetical protein
LLSHTAVDRELTLSRSFCVNPSLLTFPILSTRRALVALMRLLAVDSGKVFSKAAKKVWVLKGGAVYVGLEFLPASPLRRPVACTRPLSVDGGAPFESGFGGGDSLVPFKFEDAGDG